MGFEPATCCLQNSCSAVELRRQVSNHLWPQESIGRESLRCQAKSMHRNERPIPSLLSIEQVDFVVLIGVQWNALKQTGSRLIVPAPCCVEFNRPL